MFFFFWSFILFFLSFLDSTTGAFALLNAAYETMTKYRTIQLEGKFFIFYCQVKQYIYCFFILRTHPCIFSFFTLISYAWIIWKKTLICYEKEHSIFLHIKDETTGCYRIANRIQENQTWSALLPAEILVWKELRLSKASLTLPWCWTSSDRLRNKMDIKSKRRNIDVKFLFNTTKDLWHNKSMLNTLKTHFITSTFVRNIEHPELL